MRMLFTVAYPELPADASAWLEDLRARHDPQHAIVAAHFTLLFGSAVTDEAGYAAHVAAVAAITQTIAFAGRSALLATDAISGQAQVHLVPDEGFDAIVRLRDRLCRGAAAPPQRTDLAYMPHITVASLPDRAAAQTLRDALARAGVQVAGRLRRLSIGTLQAGRFYDLSHHALADHL